jgi:hypothetical protein
MPFKTKKQSFCLSALYPHYQAFRRSRKSNQQSRMNFSVTESLNSSSLNGSVRRRRSGRRGSEKSEKEVVPEKSKTKLIDNEEAATGSVGWGVYVRYFKSIGLTLGLTAVISNALMQASSVYSGSK